MSIFIHFGIALALLMLLGAITIAMVALPIWLVERAFTHMSRARDARRRQTQAQRDIDDITMAAAEAMARTVVDPWPHPGDYIDGTAHEVRS